MSHPPFILADDFDGWGKLIGVVIVGLFWGISALASVIKKANEQARRNAAMQPRGSISQSPQAQAATQFSFKPTPQAPRVAPLPPRNQPPIPQRATQPQAAVRRAVQPVPPPLPAMQAAPVSRAGATTNPKPITSAPAATKTGPSAANAATIRRWLQPGTVRRQFILTELFQPALALREPRKML